VAVISELVSRVRVELGDMAKQFRWSGEGDGSNKDFYLDVKPIDPNTLVIRVNNVPIPTPSGYTLEKDHGMIHFAVAPANNAVITAEGTHYRYFTDADIEHFIDTAATQHTHNRSDSYGRAMTLAKISAVEEYPLVILSSIEALWVLATDSAFDINIFAPDGVTIPRSERFHQLSNIIQQRWEQYKQLCAALNIGLWRIEIGTLRRTSRITNKLVPVYVPQEIDDSRRPERVYLPTDVMGRNPLPSTAGIYDIVLYQGDSWYALFDFPDNTDFNDLVFKAQIRTYPNSPSLWATFNITVEDAPTKKLRLSLTKAQTQYMPVRAFWDLQATSLSDPDFEKTYIRGQVFCEREITD
jgi:hypothetical protein